MCNSQVSTDYFSGLFKTVYGRQEVSQDVMKMLVGMDFSRTVQSEFLFTFWSRKTIISNIQLSGRYNLPFIRATLEGLMADLTRRN